MEKITIKHRFNDTVLYEVEAESLKDALAKAVASGANLRGAYLSGANLRGANLSDANLSGANLSDANLSGANLSDAYLSDANLSGANLSGANLRGANLSDAYLSGANLSDANLSGANLRGANLSGANLSDANLRGANLSGATRLETGETFDEYKKIVLPELFKAAGTTLESVVASGSWECHTWSNCPMHAAFKINSADEGPMLHRPRIHQFVRLFDAGLLKAADLGLPASNIEPVPMTNLPIVPVNNQTDESDQT